MSIQNTRRAVAALILAGALAGCQTGQMGTKETIGTLGGAAAGGLIGSQFGGGSGKLLATGLGVLAGAFAGRELGASLDKADEAHATQAESRALRAKLGEPIRWKNPGTGNSGSVTPIREGTDAGGNVCREFLTTLAIGGKSQNAYGTACQQSDGSWKIQP
ncbi:RT0821/Lpp0805 family surface protein [Azospirillum sp. sgz302134]